MASIFDSRDERVKLFSRSNLLCSKSASIAKRSLLSCSSLDRYNSFLSLRSFAFSFISTSLASFSLLATSFSLSTSDLISSSLSCSIILSLSFSSCEALALASFDFLMASSCLPSASSTNFEFDIDILAISP